MSAFPSLPLFTDAYIADTAHLTNEEHGAYLRLLMFAWRSPDCRLPDDDARITRMLGLTAKRWSSLKPAVMAFWSLDDGFWTQKRLTREHEFVTEKVEKKRAAGKQGGRPKSLENNDLGKASGYENGKQNESERKAPTPTPINTPIVPKGTDAGFANFRAAFPKKKSSFPTETARKRYDAAIKNGASEADLERSARNYAAEQADLGNIGTQYVKSADAFLFSGKWKDYLGGQSQPVAVSSEDYLARLSDDRWRDALRQWKKTGGQWDLSRHSSPPDSPKTKVPQRFLTEFGIAPRDFHGVHNLLSVRAA
ncbi:YdaU family protein [Methylobacterium sp. Leaf106]|uniref:YdaU family protein n=1 Tax=Methylobacterium sp. Leaf106 TaxID=1736255 RepID=UPI000701583C|nr:DUF1376 domain-containing protein [Methylobacterium sp. Leaf106]KQP53054.1 hypothetical protein ASF34_01405 [Methylobacterium sp. Leaf106]